MIGIEGIDELGRSVYTVMGVSHRKIEIHRM